MWSPVRITISRPHAPKASALPPELTGGYFISYLAPTDQNRAGRLLCAKSCY